MSMGYLVVRDDPKKERKQCFVVKSFIVYPDLEYAKKVANAMDSTWLHFDYPIYRVLWRIVE